MASPEQSQQQTLPQPGTKSGLRYWVNIAFGLIVILGIIVGAFFLMEYFYNRSKDKNQVHFILYNKGRADFQQDLIISYNQSPVGRIDSAVTNVEAIQLYVRKDDDLSQTWYVLTMQTATKGDEAHIDGSFVIRLSTEGDIQLVTNEATELFRISDSYSGILHAKDSSVRYNGGPPKGSDVYLRAGDDISFRVQNKGYTLRWNPRDIYTRMYCSIDSTQLGGATLLKLNSKAALLTHSASISISNTFGLTKTTAKFTPAFTPDIVRHSVNGMIEVQPDGGFDLSDLQSALAYLSSPKTMNQTPSSRLERIISSVDSVGLSTASVTRNIDAVTVPSVNQTIATVNNETLPQLKTSLQRLVDSLSQQVKNIEHDFKTLTLQADTTIVGIGNDVKPAMKSVRQNLDAISEQIRRLREEINATNKSIKAITDDPVKKLTK